MADVTKGSGGVDGLSANRCVVLSELFAGEALDRLDACAIHSDGKVYQAKPTYQATLTGFADFLGFTNKHVYSGEPVSLFGAGVVLGYAASGLTPGKPLFVSVSGMLADAKVAANDTPVAIAISATDILVIK